MPFSFSFATRLGGILAVSLLAAPSASAQLTEIPAQRLGLVPLPREVKAYTATYALPQKVSIYAVGKDGGMWPVC
ncbi:hypothetical protein [Hymenobacter cellulosilyticus]|uniref:Xylanase n=1 Tax=Hymenobacter cellulosilyticus TaxID=2932248 RepID=A0A8T9Q5M2_9BACT|nr:hypothetical protein [Hymenobacter cellulosilyticus]UOQ71070.1 hypothetical protein MUN79_20710 [Hymenobacter cellulosilyticus]